MGRIFDFSDLLFVCGTVFESTAYSSLTTGYHCHMFWVFLFAHQ